MKKNSTLDPNPEHDPIDLRFTNGEEHFREFEGL